jgi:hypothetical protein
MTILRTNYYSANLPTIIEDPTPGADLIFFQNEGYKLSTLGAIFNTTISYNVAGTGYSTWGTSNFQQNTDGWYWQGALVLNGEVTHCKHLSVAVNDYRNNLDHSPWASMDLSNKIKPIQYYTNGTNNLVQAFLNVQGTAGASNYTNWLRRQNTTFNLSVGYPTYNGNPSSTSNTAFPVYRNTQTNNIVCVGNYNSSAYHPGAYAGYNLSGAFTVSTPAANAVTAVANASCQFVGVGVGGLAIMLVNDVSTDYTQTFYRYNDSANTAVTLNTYNLVPQTTSTGAGGVGVYLLSNRHETATGSIAVTGTSPAASVTGYVIGKTLSVTAVTSGAMAVGQTIAGTGIIAGTTIIATGTNVTTSAGGARTNAYLPKYASSTFVDLSTASTRGFYVPYFDTNSTFQPFYFQWNTITDNFVRNQDIRVLYTTGTSMLTYWLAETASGTSVNVTYGSQRAWYNESFIYNNVRYLTFMQLHGAGTVMDTNSLQRTFMTYTVDTSTYKTLTYHSSVAIPATPKNIVWLNDNRTTMGVFGHTAFWIYSFTAAGWSLIKTEPYSFSAVGRDSLGRVWGMDSGPLGGGRAHLILSDTTSVPATISLVPSQQIFNYTGTNQLFTFALDAYNSGGSRIAVNVTLAITGNSLRILDSSSTQVISYTTATSTSTSTVVNAAIIAGGPSSIATTIAL